MDDREAENRALAEMVQASREEFARSYGLNNRDGSWCRERKPNTLRSIVALIILNNSTSQQKIYDAAHSLKGMGSGVSPNFVSADEIASYLDKAADKLGSKFVGISPSDLGKVLDKLGLVKVVVVPEKPVTIEKNEDETISLQPHLRQFSLPEGAALALPHMSPRAREAYAKLLSED